MARSANPLNRDEVQRIAQDAGASYESSRTNTALQLASSLSDISPVAQETIRQVGAQLQAKQTARAKKDVLETQGVALADAVRDGKLEPTSNPWYVQAYARESAAVRVQTQLAALQVDSASWAEKNDPEAFAARWRESVGEISKGYSGIDEGAGIQPVEAQFTQQALQSNLSSNVQRIQQERVQNLSALTAQALLNTLSSNGGTITPNQAKASTEAARAQWFATGGTQAEWNKVLTEAVTSAGYASLNPDLIDLIKAPELLGGISDTGDHVIGAGGDDHDLLGEVSNEIQPASPSPSPIGRTSRAKVGLLPVQGARVSAGGEFGVRRGPKGEAHGGLDLAVPEGTPIRATADGVVNEINTSGNGASGKFVRVGSSGDIVSGFAHMSKVLVNPGQKVRAGDIIGYSGNTGRSKGPHVHWRVTKAGKNVDPRTVDFDASLEADAAPPPLGTTLKPLPANTESSSPKPLSPANRGLSLYQMPGVAADVETARYRITQAAEAGQTKRLQAMNNARKVAGAEASDYLWAQHGTNILKGDYNERELITEMTGKGYTPQVIVEALGSIRGAVGDVAALQSARLALRGGDPEKGRRIMDLALEGRRNGYSKDYEDRVGLEVLSGQMSGDDGTAMVATALAETDKQASQGRAAASAARAEAKAAGGTGGGGRIKSYSALKQEAMNLAILMRGQLQRKGYTTSAGVDAKTGFAANFSNLMLEAMQAHLGANPGDFSGAYQAARQRAADYYRTKRPVGARQSPQAGVTNSQGRNPAGNPRR